MYLSVYFLEVLVEAGTCPLPPVVAPEINLGLPADGLLKFLEVEIGYLVLRQVFTIRSAPVSTGVSWFRNFIQWCMFHQKGVWSEI